MRGAGVSRLLRLWRGDLSLEDAFWNWAVIGGLVVNLTSSLGFLLLVAEDRLIAACLVGYGLSLPYNLLATVGVWRSAGRYKGDRRRAQLARAIVVIGMVILGIT